MNKSPREIKIIAGQLIQDLEALPKENLENAIRAEFAVYEEQEQLTDKDKKAIFAAMYESDFKTDPVMQSMVSVLEIQVMMELCDIECYILAKQVHPQPA